MCKREERILRSILNRMDEQKTMTVHVAFAMGNECERIFLGVYTKIHTARQTVEQYHRCYKGEKRWEYWPSSAVVLLDAEGYALGIVESSPLNEE
jgi:hypothetical protein